jgi:hypothetical protein
MGTTEGLAAAGPVIAVTFAFFTATTYFAYLVSQWLAIDAKRSRYVSDMLGEKDVVDLGRRTRRNRDPYVQDLVFAIKSELGTPTKSSSMDRLIRDKTLRMLAARDSLRNRDRHTIVAKVLTLVYLETDVDMEENAIAKCTEAKRRARGSRF